MTFWPHPTRPEKIDGGCRHSPVDYASSIKLTQRDPCGSSASFEADGLRTKERVAC